MGMSSNEFAAAIRSIDVGDRQIRVRQKILGSDTIYVNFYNCPDGVGGADFENNRMMFSISGFDKKDQDIKSERLRLELVVSMFPRERGFRAKNAKPETILPFLIEFIKSVARDFEPNLFAARSTGR
jgi:hypothetical protein